MRRTKSRAAGLYHNDCAEGKCPVLCLVLGLLGLAWAGRGTSALIPAEKRGPEEASPAPLVLPRAIPVFFSFGVAWQCSGNRMAALLHTICGQGGTRVSFLLWHFGMTSNTPTFCRGGSKSPTHQPFFWDRLRVLPLFMQPAAAGFPHPVALLLGVTKACLNALQLV